MDKIATMYKGIQWVSSFFEKTERPNFLLDPLTTIIKLAMLKYKTPYTKIRINQNKLSYSDPTAFQGVSRWLMGDSRNNHHYLYLPVLYFCYLKYNCGALDEPYSTTLKSVIDFYNELAVDGLQALRTTYLESKNDLVLNCLDLYILMLNSEDETSIKDRYLKINIATKNTYDEFLKCWNQNNIEVLTGLFKELEAKSSDTMFVSKTLEGMEHYLEAINYKIDILRSP